MTFSTEFQKYRLPSADQKDWDDEILNAWKALDSDIRGINSKSITKETGDFTTLTAESVVSESVGETAIVHPETDGSRYIATGNEGVISKDINAATVIQAALDAVSAGVVVLVASEFVIDSTLTVPKNVALCGQGIGTTLRLADNANTTVCEIDGSWATISQLHIDGNNTNNTSGHGIVIQAPTYRPTLQYVVVDNCAQDGILATGSSSDFNYETAIYSVQTKGHGRNGYKSEFTADTYAAHLYAEDCGQHGVYELTAGNTYVHVHGYNSLNGIYLSPFASDIQLVAPYGETNQRRGIFIKADHCTVSDPLCYDNSQVGAGTYPGILLDGASDITIHGGRSYNKSGSQSQDYGVKTANNPTECRIWGLDTNNNRDGGYSLSGTRLILNGQSENSGDPNTTGDWNGFSSLAYNHGVLVWNRATTPWTGYRADGGGNWIQIT